MSPLEFLYTVVNGLPRTQRELLQWLLRQPGVLDEALSIMEDLKPYQRASTPADQLSQASLALIGKEIIRRALPHIADEGRREATRRAITAGKAHIARRRAPGPSAAVLIDADLRRDHNRAMRIFHAARPIVARGFLSSVAEVAHMNAVSEVAGAIAATRRWSGMLPIRYPAGEPDFLPVVASQELLREYTSRIGRAVISATVATLSRSALASMATTAPISLNTVSRQAEIWSRTQGANLVRGINHLQRLAIREAIAGIYAQPLRGIPEAERRIRESIGLLPNQVRALNIFREQLHTQGLPSVLVRARAREYHGRLLTERANLIASTESMAALNAGRIMLWVAGAETGVVDRRATKRWVTAPNRREAICKICRPLDGVEVELLENFDLKGGGPMGKAGPPAHPRCRCVLVLGSGERNLLVLDHPGLLRRLADMLGPQERELPGLPQIPAQT